MFRIHGLLDSCSGQDSGRRAGGGAGKVESETTMKRLTLGVMLLALGLGLTACGVVIDSEGAKIGNPADFAQATHIAQMSDAAAISTRTAVDIVSTRQVADIQARATEQAARVNAAATASAIDHQAAQARADEVKAGAAVVVAQAETEQRAQGAALAGRPQRTLCRHVGRMKDCAGAMSLSS